MNRAWLSWSTGHHIKAPAYPVHVLKSLDIATTKSACSLISLPDLYTREAQERMLKVITQTPQVLRCACNTLQGKGILETL